jgi:hypothetical protein
MSAGTEAALEDSEQHLRYALQAAAAGAWEWDIDAESGGPGMGSKFTVRLPLAVSVTDKMSEDQCTSEQAKPAVRRIREHSWADGVVLVALTGWGQEEDRQKSKDAGFNGHLVKPVDHAALMKLLANS